MRTILQQMIHDLKNNGFNVLFTVRTKATTLNGINRAIERNTGEKHYYTSMLEIEQARREGFFTTCTDGFIIYVDGK